METTTGSGRDWVSTGEDRGGKEKANGSLWSWIVSSVLWGLTFSTQEAWSLIKYLQALNVTTKGTQWDEGKLQFLWESKIRGLELDWDFKKGLSVRISCPWTLSSGQFRSLNVSCWLICAENSEQFQSVSYPPRLPTLNVSHCTTHKIFNNHSKSQSYISMCYTIDLKNN